MRQIFLVVEKHVKKLLQFKKSWLAIFGVTRNAPYLYEYNLVSVVWHIYCTYMFSITNWTKNSGSAPPAMHTTELRSRSHIDRSK